MPNHQLRETYQAKFQTISSIIFLGQRDARDLNSVFQNTFHRELVGISLPNESLD